MAKLKSWYDVVELREDLRDNRPLDASEFAIHLDQIQDGRAHKDYTDPERFFDRTYVTGSLLDLSSQVLRRLSGIQVETSAVFNMATQFGGGKSHSLLALYHLARNGEKAKTWNGVDRILRKAEITTVPEAAIAVFMFSLAGVPPLAGFWGKFALFSGAIDLGAPVAGVQSDVQPWFLALAIIGVANAAIAAAYYLRVVATMYFRSPESAAAPVDADAVEPTSYEPAPAMAAAICLVLVIAVGVLPWPAIDVSDAAGSAVTQSTAVEPTGGNQPDTVQLSGVQ